tara:strand:+ start:7199 stop:7960 length:762 start_codon:yes stop_codon:yes gene_type:complete
MIAPVYCISNNTNDFLYFQDYFYIFGQLFSIFSVGIGIAILIVSNCIKQDLYDDVEVEDENEKYSLSYYDEFEELEDIEYDKDFYISLQNIYVNDVTPLGNIIMTYNHEYEAFWYYAKRRDIPYAILDAVAQKFSIENNCKSICVNYKDEYFKGKESVENTESNIDNMESNMVSNMESNGENKKKSVFVTPKSYNMTTKKEPEKKYILTEKANRFTFKGFLDDWRDPSKINKREEQRDKIKQLNFETFKKMKL